MLDTKGNFLYHTACAECGSSDANAVYDNQTSYCFACGATKQNLTTKKHKHTNEIKTPQGFLKGVSKALLKRGISLNTCLKWGYEVGKDTQGVTCQIANYFDNLGNKVNQKLRYAGKAFKTLGAKNPPLYGSWLWDSKEIKTLIITEGEIDALSISQVYNHKRPVVSVPNGANGAKKALKNNLEFLSQFSNIILAFDNDDVGRAAMSECATLFKAGSVSICIWQNAKDANEKLVNGDLQGLHYDLKNAKAYRPDGLINGAELDLNELKAPLKLGLAYPYTQLQDMTYGSRGGELIIWTAGSGIGKSTILRELAYHFITTNADAKVGMVFLEENLKKTATAFIALDNNIPLAKLRYDPKQLSAEDWANSKQKLFDSSRVIFYNHFGSLDSNTLLEKLRFMAVGLGVSHIFLDHISIAISGNESENERKDIDILMTNLRSLVEETQVHIDAIVHLKRSNKGSFNEGLQVSLSDLRGSGGLEQLSDAVIALERNQQSTGGLADVVTLRVLKNRELGIVGKADKLRYNHQTGRLEPFNGLDINQDLTIIQEVNNDDF